LDHHWFSKKRTRGEHGSDHREFCSSYPSFLIFLLPTEFFATIEEKYSCASQLIFLRNEEERIKKKVKHSRHKKTHHNKGKILLSECMRTLLYAS
jgi:hypothetical protein